jgi:hypothetical protein
MKSLECVVIGDGSVFVVDIDERKKVGHLKKMIKEENGYSLPAKDLILYLAKKGGNWLTTGDPDVTMLENGEVPEGISAVMKKRENKMDPRYRIGNAAFNFPDEDDAGEDEIHVLVAVPGHSWPTHTGSANKEPHPTRKRRWEELNELLDGNKKAKIKYGESSTGYSYVSFKGVNKVMPADQYEQSTKAIDDDNIDVLYAYLLVVAKAFVEVVTGTEAKRTHFIAPVLACVCALFNGDVQIRAEEKVEGKRAHGDGQFEFVIKRGSKRLCVVEAKKSDMEQGLAQAYVGSEVLSAVEGLSTVYNVVTSYKDWYFSRILDERVERDEATMKFVHDIPTRDSAKEIAEKIYAMLSEDE